MLQQQQNRPITKPTLPALEWFSLYDACLSPNPARQAAAYQRLGELLLPWARYCLYTKPGFQAEAADCVQEALLDIWKGLANQCGPTRQAQSFKNWCITIVSHKVLDLLRRRAYRVQQLCTWDSAENEWVDVGTVDLEDMIIDRVAFCTLLRDLFNHPGLSSTQRQILWLQCVEGQEYAEIAQRLQKAETTIRVNRHRAIIALQKDTVFMRRLHATLAENNDVKRAEQKQ